MRHDTRPGGQENGGAGHRPPREDRTEPGHRSAPTCPVREERRNRPRACPPGRQWPEWSAAFHLSRPGSGNAAEQTICAFWESDRPGLAIARDPRLDAGGNHSSRKNTSPHPPRSERPAATHAQGAEPARNPETAYLFHPGAAPQQPAVTGLEALNKLFHTVGLNGREPPGSDDPQHCFKLLMGEMILFSPMPVANR